MPARSKQTTIGQALQRPDLEPASEPVRATNDAEQVRLFEPAPAQMPGQMILDTIHTPNAPGPGPLQR